MVISRQERPQAQTSPAPQAANNVPPQVKMLQMMNAYRLSQSISVAARLGIADLLADGPKSSEQLAQLTETHAPSLYRLLRALASFSIFAEDENGLFSLTPRAAMLQANVPGSIRGYAVVIGEEWHWRTWGDIIDSVKTGAPAFDRLYGMEFQDYYDSNPEVAQNFDAAMVSALAMTDVGILSYDFSSHHKIVDVGTGGQKDGKLIASILKKNPEAQGIYFDLPSRIEAAKCGVEAEVANRCEFLAGNVFESFPKDGDAYIIKNLIHDYDDERAIQILRNCRSAIAQNGKLLVVEMIIPPGNEMSLGKILDVEALIMTTGAIERTEEQYKEILKASGFNVTNVISTRTPMSIIEAVPV